MLGATERIGIEAILGTRGASMNTRPLLLIAAFRRGLAETRPGGVDFLACVGSYSTAAVASDVGGLD